MRAAGSFGNSVAAGARPSRYSQMTWLSVDCKLAHQQGPATLAGIGPIDLGVVWNVGVDRDHLDPIGQPFHGGGDPDLADIR